MCVVPLWLFNQFEQPNWQCAYMCPLSDICDRLDEIIQRADGFKQLPA